MARRTESGRLPAELLPPRNAPTGWPADAARLLDWLRPQITPEQLEGIAASDYSDDLRQHLRPLTAIVRSGRIVTPVRWHPGEVLSLTQWDESGEDPVVRLFACCVLCLDADSGHRPGIEATLAIALESALDLGDEAVAGYAALCAAMAECLPSYDPPHLFSLLGLALSTAALGPDAAWWEGVKQRLVDVEMELSATGYSNRRHGWLLGTTHFEQRHGLWRKLSRRTLGPADLFETTPTP